MVDNKHNGKDLNMNKEKSFIQIFKRIIIGIMCFFIALFLTYSFDERLGLISIFSLILMISYPSLLDKGLNKFFNDKLHKFIFLKRLHFIIFFIIAFSNAGLASKGEKITFVTFPLYSLILAIVFSIKKWKFIKQRDLKQQIQEKKLKINKSIFIMLSLAIVIIGISIHLNNKRIIKDIVKGKKTIRGLSEDGQIMIGIIKGYSSEVEKINDKFSSEIQPIMQKFFKNENVKSIESISSMIKEIERCNSLIDKHSENQIDLYKNYRDRIKLSKISNLRKEQYLSHLDKSYQMASELLDNYFINLKQFLAKSKRYYEFILNNYHNFKITNGKFYFNAEELVKEFNLIINEVEFYKSKMILAIENYISKAKEKLSLLGLSEKDFDSFLSN